MPATDEAKPTRKGTVLVEKRKDGTPVWVGKWRDSTRRQMKRTLGTAYLIGRQWDPNYPKAGHGEAWRNDWIEPLTRKGNAQDAPAGKMNFEDAKAALKTMIVAHEEATDQEAVEAAERAAEAERRAAQVAEGEQTLEAIGTRWLDLAELRETQRPSTLVANRAALRMIAGEPIFRRQPNGFEWPNGPLIPTDADDKEAAKIRREFERNPAAHRRSVARQWPARRVDEITKAEVEAWRDGLLAQGLTKRTANRNRQLLSSVLKFAVEREDYPLTENVAAQVAPVEERGRKRLEFYEPAEVEHLARVLREGSHRRPKKMGVGKREPGRTAIVREMSADEASAAAWQDRHDGALVQTLAYAGLRLGEALALRWHHVHFDTEKLEVERSYSVGVEGPTKSGHERWVPLTSQVAQVLAQLSQRDHFTGREDLVFCNPTGDYLDPSAFRRRFKAAIVVAELRPLRIHDLRHGFLSHAAKVLSLPDVQRLAGHQDPRTTSRYMHSKPGPDEAAKLGAVFATGTPTEIIAPTSTAQ